MSDSQRYAAAGFLGAAAMVLTLSSVSTGCGFRAGLAKAHQGVKVMSREVEPRLADECLRRARVCRAQHVERPEQCAPLMACRKLKRRYLQATITVHRGLQGCRAAYEDMLRAGVIR